MGIEDATVLADSLLNYPPAAADEDNFGPALNDYAKRRVGRSQKLTPLVSVYESSI